jgi:hypothetical protein
VRVHRLPNHFSRFPSQNPFVDRRFPAVYHDSHLIGREAMTDLPLFALTRSRVLSLLRAG